MATLDLSPLLSLFAEGQSFTITEKQYEQLFHKPLPSAGYLKWSSPIGKAAKKYGYRLRLERQEQRVVVFEKMAQPEQQP